MPAENRYQHFKVENHRQYKKEIRSAQDHFDKLLVDVTAQKALEILNQVFKIKVQGQTYLNDDKAVNLKTIETIGLLTANPQTTAISFLVFTQKLLQNESVVNELESKGLLKLNENNDNGLEQLSSLLDTALDYRANYDEHYAKMLNSLVTAIIAGGIGFLSFALGGPIGVAIAGGVVAAAAILYMGYNASCSSSKPSVVNEQMNQLQKNHSELIQQLNTNDDVKGFMGLLTTEVAFDADMTDRTIFELTL